MSERRSIGEMSRKLSHTVSNFMGRVAFEFGEATRAWGADQHIDALNDELLHMQLMGDGNDERRAGLTNQLAEARAAKAKLTEEALARQGQSREN